MGESLGSGNKVSDKNTLIAAGTPPRTAARAQHYYQSLHVSNWQVASLRWVGAAGFLRN